MARLFRNIPASFIKISLGLSVPFFNREVFRNRCGTFQIHQKDDSPKTTRQQIIQKKNQKSNVGRYFDKTQRTCS